MILCTLKGILPFKGHEIICFSENLKKILGFTSKLRQGRVTLNTGIFLFGLINSLHSEDYYVSRILHNEIFHHTLVGKNFFFSFSFNILIIVV